MLQIKLKSEKHKSIEKNETCNIPLNEANLKYGFFYHEKLYHRISKGLSNHRRQLQVSFFLQTLLDSEKIGKMQR